MHAECQSGPVELCYAGVPAFALSLVSAISWTVGAVFGTALGLALLLSEIKPGKRHAPQVTSEALIP